MRKLICFVLLLIDTFFASADQIKYQVDPLTGGLKAISIDGDTTAINWVMDTDGSQYPWITDGYTWGLGYLTEYRNHSALHHVWHKPIHLSDTSSIYNAGKIRIEVSRQTQPDGSMIETYVFSNEGGEVAALQDIGIYTPFNDNYPDTKTCIDSRAHAHIWTGKSGAWVYAVHMGAQTPNLGLTVTKGSVDGYQVHERGRRKGSSMYRGVFSLNLPDLWLKPDESYTLQWRISSNDSQDDFIQRIKEDTGIYVQADNYVGQVGDTIKMHLYTPENKIYGDIEVTANKYPLKASVAPDGYTVQVPIYQPGDIDIEIRYGGRTTTAQLLGICNPDSLIRRRVNFIMERQQLDNPSDPRHNAYMIYDNEADSIYLNDTPNANPVDRDEGAERTGMGVLLAKMYRLTGDTIMGKSVKDYAAFVREKLQSLDYKTYSSVDQNHRNRGYNYMFVANLYFQLYMATQDPQYAIDGYETLRSMFRQFGHNFYAIGIPVRLSLDALQNAGMLKERDCILEDFRLLAATMIANGLNYPPFEVNYEQSIVAPAIQFLAQMYQVTGEKAYLDEVFHQLPVLQAFSGMQPSYHLNGIGIRHWDGYWFGKRELFGDTFPHYWSTITAAAYHYLYQITGEEEYQREAKNIVDNNLCLFFEDGKASCAYLYPNKIDGVRAHFYDPYGNDQDWALVYYLLVNSDM